MALTAKQEAFCRGVALDKLTQSASYARAYDTSKMTESAVSSKAAQTAAIPEVRERIAVLIERATTAAVKKAAYTLADAIKEADTAMQDGMALGQVSAAVAAIKLKAQLGGHLVERKEVVTKHLEAADIEVLEHMQKEIATRLKRAREAKDLTGEEDKTTITQPVRRAIG